ncbi:MAG: hypothetical protein MK110_17410 [Fuerstiella sp.]|nr:hypothetical protein [Fuerstiella sp.]
MSRLKHIVRQTMLILIVWMFLLISISATSATAALPLKVRRELGRMTKDARSVTGLVRRKKIDEAQAVIDELIRRTEQLGVKDGERDRVWRTFRSQFDRARNLIPVGFEADIAPVLSARCVSCHGAEDNPAAGLRLDTFSGLRRGSRGGALLKPGDGADSLIMKRLTNSDDRQRMPRNSARLTNEQLRIIGKWINDGAIFDGTDEDAPIVSSTETPPEDIEIVMADGTGTVSFISDVAPIFVNFCLRCHRGDTPAGGYSVVTITDVLRGGDTGNTIIPGNSNDSYLWKLVGLQDPIKMPQGPARLKRSQAQTLKTWIQEGAHFDGDDATVSLRNMVPTEAETAARELASMSSDDFALRRIQQAKSIWKRAVPGENADNVTTDNFYICGNVPENRLRQFATLAEAQLARLQKLHDDHKTAWRGRLVIFASRDRFEYTEFNTVLRDQRTPQTVHGHVVITPQLATAYVVLHDYGSQRSASELTSDQLVNSLVAQAWLARDGSNLPDWLTEGFGLLESGIEAKSLTRLKAHAIQAAATVKSPEDLFGNDRFSPADKPIVGALLIRFLQTPGNAKFTEFLNAARTTSNAAEAIQSTYRQPAESVARGFLTSLSR